MFIEALLNLVFGVPGDPDPSAMLRDWKSYASRALNRSGAKPNAPRWWADQGKFEQAADLLGMSCDGLTEARSLPAWKEAETLREQLRSRSRSG